MSEKQINERVLELKLELLKQSAKRKGIKKEVARLLTLRNKNSGEKNKQ